MGGIRRHLAMCIQTHTTSHVRMDTIHASRHSVCMSMIWTHDCMSMLSITGCTTPHPHTTPHLTHTPHPHATPTTPCMHTRTHARTHTHTHTPHHTCMYPQTHTHTMVETCCVRETDLSVAPASKQRCVATTEGAGVV